MAPDFSHNRTSPAGLDRHRDDFYHVLAVVHSDPQELGRAKMGSIK